MTTILLLGLLLLTLLGMPLFAVFAGASLALFNAVEIDLQATIIELYRIASAPTLIAIPLFTFAGYMLAEAGTPRRLVAVSQAILGWMPGGLALVALIACAFFTALTGASGVTIVALGGLLYPALIRAKYGEDFSLGLMTVGGSLGLLFPPSLPIILYGFVAETSINQLFVAGVIPGVILIVVLSLYGFFIGKKQDVPRQAFDRREVARTLREAAWEVPLPVLLLLGIYSGKFTPSEAAAITAFYVFVVEVFIYRDIKFGELPKIMRESMVLVGAILIILCAGLGFTSYLIDQEIPQKILEHMQKLIHSQLAFLLVLNVFLLIVGCLMDIFTALIVVVPLIVPIAREFDVNMVHLGIIFLTNLEIGYATPPVGLNLFIASFRFKKPVLQLYRAAVPYLILLIGALLLITYVPWLSLVLIETFDVK